MSSKSIITHITPVGGNIFADLGFEPKEAARLLAETDQAISEKLAIKDRQAHSIVCPMKCPVCGAADLVHDTRDLSYTYKGESTMISSVTGDFCPACAESILGAAESERVMREIHAFNKQVNASIVDPEFIASVRKIKNHSLRSKMPRE